MNTYQPYTYLIGWSDLDRWYYGVRFGKNCHPSDLWVTYFTSSKHIALFREEHGEPDIIQIRRTFETAKSAQDWEEKVLRKMNAHINERFINANIAGAISPEVASISKKKYWRSLSLDEKEKVIRKSRDKISKEVRSRTASIAGKASALKRTVEQKLEFGRRASEARINATTPEERSKCGIVGMKSRWGAMTSEERSIYNSERMKRIPDATCIHCKRTLKKHQITRFHNENCKQNPNHARQR